MLRRIQRRLALTLHRRPLLPFLLAATLAVNFVLASLDNGSGPVSFYSAATLFAEAALLAVWATKLRRGWEWRLLAAKAGLLIACTPWAVQPAVGIDGGVLLVVWLCSMAFLVVAFAARLVWLGVAVTLRRRRLATVRFSIRDIVLLMTLIAVVCVLGKWLAPAIDTEAAVVTLGLALWGGTPMAAAVACHHTRRTWQAIGIALLGVVIVAGSAASATTVVLPYLPPERVLYSILWQGVFCLVWLVGLRVRGRRRRIKPQETPPRLRAVSPRDEADGAGPAADEPAADEPNTPRPIDYQA